MTPKIQTNVGLDPATREMLDRLAAKDRASIVWTITKLIQTEASRRGLYGGGAEPEESDAR
jgi:hypothetical protein